MTDPTPPHPPDLQDAWAALACLDEEILQARRDGTLWVQLRRPRT